MCQSGEAPPDDSDRRIPAMTWPKTLQEPARSKRFSDSWPMATARRAASKADEVHSVGQQFSLWRRSHFVVHFVAHFVAPFDVLAVQTADKVGDKVSEEVASPCCTVRL